MLEQLHDPLVDIVVPVYNEERVLASSIATLSKYLERDSPFGWRLVIADNASTDATPEIGRAVSESFARVQYAWLEQKGRGGALKAT